MNDTCHCGRPVKYGFDGDPNNHRGMCSDCDLVRCDAYPDECPYPPSKSLGPYSPCGRETPHLTHVWYYGDDTGPHVALCEGYEVKKTD